MNGTPIAYSRKEFATPPHKQCNKGTPPQIHRLDHRPDGQDSNGQGVLLAGDPEDTGRCYTLSRWFSVKRRLSNPRKVPVSLDNMKNGVTLSVLSIADPTPDTLDGTLPRYYQTYRN